MKQFTIYFTAILFAITGFACNPKQNVENEVSNEATADKVEVYYFHYTRRCATCNAVESVTKETLNEYYSDEMKDGKIVFRSVNLDNDDSDAIAQTLKVSGQSLLFVSGNKQVDLTNEGFMYAKDSADKLKTKVKETVDTLLIKL